MTIDIILPMMFVIFFGGLFVEKEFIDGSFIKVAIELNYRILFPVFVLSSIAEYQDAVQFLQLSYHWLLMLFLVVAAGLWCIFFQRSKITSFRKNSIIATYKIIIPLILGVIGYVFGIGVTGIVCFIAISVAPAFDFFACLFALKSFSKKMIHWDWLWLGLKRIILHPAILAGGCGVYFLDNDTTLKYVVGKAVLFLHPAMLPLGLLIIGAMIGDFRRAGKEV